MNIHPRTALWFEQRETCYKCSNLVRLGTEMVCAALPPQPRRVVCIDAREPHGACGPEAKLFDPAVVASDQPPQR